MYDAYRYRCVLNGGHSGQHIGGRVDHPGSEAVLDWLTPTGHAATPDSEVWNPRCSLRPSIGDPTRR